MSDNENGNVIEDEEEEVEEVSNKVEINKGNQINEKKNVKGKEHNKRKEQEKNNNINDISENENYGVEKIESSENNIIEESYPENLDPNVRKLIELDFNKIDRNEIAELLLQDNLLSTNNINSISNKNLTQSSKYNLNTNTINKNYNSQMIKKENKKEDKYKNISSTIKNYLSGNLNKKNYYNNEYINNPELTYDFKSATQKVISKLSEKEKNSEIMKILFPEGLNKKQNHNFNERINLILLKKQKDLERIATQCNDEYNKNHTFNPKINKKDNNKRSLKQFIKDEEDHLNKMKCDIEKLKKEQFENFQKNNPLIPKINKTKKYDKKNEKKEIVYNRLYYNRNKNAKNELIKNEKELNEKNELKKKKLQEIKNRKISVTRPKSQVKEKPVVKKYFLLDKDLSTNKIFLKYFEGNFKNICKNFFENNNNVNENNDFENYENELNYVGEDELNEINQVNNNNEEKKEEEKKEEEEKKVEEEKKEEEKKEEEKKEEEKKEELEKKINVNSDNKLSLPQLNEFLYELGMCSKPLPETNSESNPIVEGTLQKEEKQLINTIYESLKDENDLIEPENLLKFLKCILGLNYYDLYREFKKNHDENEINSIINEQKPKNDKIDFIINKQNEENESKIDKENKRNNKYISFDKDNNLIIPISKSKAIKKDFHIFSINYISKKNKKKKEKEKEEEKYSFKPNINKKSQKLYEEIIINLKETEEKNDENNNNNNNHKEFIERLYNQNNKKLIQYEKMREELEKKELENCTFKPKTNNFSSITKARGANRFNELFHKGSQKEKSRKNKTQDEFEFEKYGSECTFRPNIKRSKGHKNNYNNDIYNEKSYRLLYDRLKKGRIERLIKENANDRFGYDDILKDYIKKNKDKEFEEKEEEEENNNSEDDNNNNNDNGNNLNNNDNDKKKKEIIEEEKEEEKKEGIPLLIIDVNIRQGVKKKIYVYEGDTPEGLAQKFANEHNLESETQEKLKNLIHNHMLRLLTRIDEENQSLSEKAQ